MTCIFPDCTKDRYSRGLCLSHYHIARNLTRTGKTSWADLEAKKKALPISKRTNTNAQKWFLQ